MAEQKREEDAVDSSDIGGAGIFLFGRELFTDSAFVARGGCDVESKCEMGGIGAFLRREALIICREGELEEIARSKTNKIVATGTVNIRAGPGSGITFETNDRHVGGHSA